MWNGKHVLVGGLTDGVDRSYSCSRCPAPSPKELPHGQAETDCSIRTSMKNKTPHVSSTLALFVLENRLFHLSLTAKDQCDWRACFPGRFPFGCGCPNGHPCPNGYPCPNGLPGRDRDARQLRVPQRIPVSQRGTDAGSGTSPRAPTGHRCVARGASPRCSTHLSGRAW